MWEIKKVRHGEEDSLLKEGWEPFGVGTEHGSYQYLDTTSNKNRTQLTNTTYIFLRKKRKPA